MLTTAAATVDSAERSNTSRDDGVVATFGFPMNSRIMVPCESEYDAFGTMAIIVSTDALVSNDRHSFIGECPLSSHLMIMHYRTAKQWWAYQLDTRKGSKASRT